jgi:hypothetical protein
MKRFISLPLLQVGLALLVAGLAGCATVNRPEFPGALKVYVNVPPSWNVLLEDDISDAFVSRVRDVFLRSGFDRPVDEVRLVEDPNKQPYLLTINLTEWRINRIGNIECTFTADLRTPQGSKNFGFFTNTTMRWMGGRWGLARSFEDAAEGAIHDLCNAVKKSELLPAFRNNEAVSRVSGKQNVTA